jgi:hypothetical protein
MKSYQQVNHQIYSLNNYISNSLTTSSYKCTQQHGGEKWNHLKRMKNKSNKEPHHPQNGFMTSF